MNKTRQNKGKGVGDEKALEVLAVIVLFLKCQHYLLRKITYGRSKKRWEVTNAGVKKKKVW